VSACDGCLRRAELIGLLAPQIGDRVRRPAERTRLLLALPDRDLVRAVSTGTADALLAQIARFDAAALRARTAAAGLEAVCRHDGAYPTGLSELEDAPRVLFVRGDVGALRDVDTTPAVAIVGGRQASTYALEVALELGRALAVAGVPVVSGLALGVDAAAHRGTLGGRGRAIAVLASGADVPYPRRHRDLYERIAASGAVVSEMPPGTPAKKWAFPARNRIMAGLARMTVVVEAADPSGSLITSDFARDLGRSVAAVPGRVTSQIARGTNGLLRDGAIPITRTEDILDELFGVGARPVAPAPPRPPPEPSDPLLRRVLRAAESHDSPTAIATAAGATVAQTRAALGRLESEGWLVRRDLAGWQRALGPADAG
jgi:DNA processing protein